MKWKKYALQFLTLKKAMFQTTQWFAEYFVFTNAYIFAD